MNMDILYALEKIRVPFFEYLLLGISYLGSEIMSVILMLVIYWCVNKKNGYFMFANILFGMGIAQAVKIHFHVPRPFTSHPDFSISDAAKTTASGFSFPSGHTQNSTSLYGSIAVSVKNSGVRILCAAMVILVAFSRMYLGAHYPTDVLAGFSVGLIVLIVLSLLFKRFGESRWFISILFGIGGAIMAAAVVMFEYGPWKTVADPEQMHDMLMAVGICSGTLLAIAAGEPLERRFVRFETKAVWWAQILKSAAGLGLFVLLLLVMKLPSEAIFGSSSLRYITMFFVPVLFSICIWPKTFRWFSKLG